MKKVIFAKQLPGGIWQWCYYAPDVENRPAVHSGDAEALAEHFNHNFPAQVVILLPGQNVLTQLQPIEESSKRHMAKLLPYEMEDDIIEPVDDLYFAFGAPSDGHVDVLYTREEYIQNAIDDLESVGADIFKVLPDYLCLKTAENECVLVIDEGILYVRTGELAGYAVEFEYAHLVVPALESWLNEERSIRIVAADNKQANALVKMLPHEWVSDNKESINAVQGEYWDALDQHLISTKLNLRSGKFARQLPFKQWMAAWKTPAIFAGVAFLLSAGSVSLANIQLKNESIAVRQQLQTVYQSVVPGGRSRDPIKALENMVSKTGNKNQPSNAMALINAVATAVQKTPDVSLTRMRYSGDQRELQVSVETPNFEDLESLRQAVADAGFVAELLRVTTQGDLQRANVKISKGSS